MGQSKTKWEQVMREEILKASRLHFQAHIEKHKINVNNLLRNVVGVAEHPDIMETIEKELAIIAEYDDKLEVLDKYFTSKNDKEVLNG
tara:strand:- start:248 stop:511 length:264 start_codon:yes stop_codon:yes gene_type:complete